MTNQNIEIVKRKLNIHLNKGKDSNLSVYEVADLLDQINFKKINQRNIIFVNYSLN